MDFLTDEYARQMVKNSLPPAKVTSVVAYSFVGVSLDVNKSIVYCGNVLGTDEKTFSLGDKTFTVKDFKGWVVFDGFTDITGLESIQFNGFRVSVQYPAKNDTLDPGMSFGYDFQFTNWYRADLVQWFLGFFSNCEKIRLFGGSYNQMFPMASDGSVIQVVGSAAGANVSYELLNGSTIIRSGTIGKAANGSFLNYWSSASSLTVANTMNSSRAQIRCDMLITSLVNGQTFMLVNMEQRKKFSFYVPGFTGATLEVWHYYRGVLMNHFIHVVVPGVDLDTGAAFADFEDLEFIETAAFDEMAVVKKSSNKRPVKAVIKAAKKIKKSVRRK